MAICVQVEGSMDGASFGSAQVEGDWLTFSGNIASSDMANGGALLLELVGARCAAPTALLRRESPVPRTRARGVCERKRVSSARIPKVSPLARHSRLLLQRLLLRGRARKRRWRWIWRRRSRR